MLMRRRNPCVRVRLRFETGRRFFFIVVNYTEVQEEIKENGLSRKGLSRGGAVAIMPCCFLDAPFQEASQRPV